MRFPSLVHFAPRIHRRASPRGQALVETAMILPILVLLLLLGIDMGRIFFTSVDLRNAAHEATMLGAVKPDATCTNDLVAVVDRQMGRDGSDGAVCGPMPVGTAGIAYITDSECERADAGPGCDPWLPNYEATADLRYMVRIEYRFQPIVPFVGLLTGNGVGGSIPMAVENRTQVLVGYEGA